MHRAIPIVLATAAAFVVVWRFEPTITTPAALPAPTVSTGEGSSDSGSSSDSTQAVAGSEESTRWGTVQVRAVFTNGELTDIQIVQAPNDGPTNRALPTLKTEALQAKSADIDTVSGATMTSEAYLRSLQAAIDSREK